MQLLPANPEHLVPNLVAPPDALPLLEPLLRQDPQRHLAVF